MSDYILVCGGGFNDKGRSVEPFDVFCHRFDNSYWPIYQNTKYRKLLREGDRIVFYVSGNKRFGGCVVAWSKIGKIVEGKKDFRAFFVAEGSVSAGNPIAYFLELSDSKRLSSPVRLKDILGRLSFKPSNEKKWGAVLQGGCRKIAAEDYSFLTEGKVA